MDAATTIILLDSAGAVVAAPTIIVVTRTGAQSASIRIETGWTRILIYYPNVAGTLIFDSDDPSDAASIINGVGYDEILLDLSGIDGGSVNASDSVVLEMTDRLGVTESDPTPFTVPRLPGGGARTRTRAVRAR
jgi:hypothetical protein